MSAEQLNTYLASHSYLGSVACATLVDFEECKATKVPVDEQKFPHLHRWHSHITALMAASITVDFRGLPVPKGTKPSLGAAKAPESAKKEVPASPKQAAAPKQAPKKEEKKGKKDASDEKKGKKEEVEKEKTPEELAEERKKQLKKVIKEGGKRGVEIEGAADMGGLQYFCTSMDEPQGDLDLLVKSMEAMNEKSDPTEEERKGGSGHIGKMIFSAGATQLAVVAYVPEAKQKELSCEEWLTAVIKSQTDGKVVSKSKGLCTAFVPTNADKGIFPLKIREPMILEANGFLRQKGLFPDNDSDDDDDPVFGDDDFPSM